MLLCFDCNFALQHPCHLQLLHVRCVVRCTFNTGLAGSNVVSVAEHVVMLILTMVRNYLPAHKQITDGGWDVGAAASKAYDLQCKTVGTVGTGAIGQLVLQRLQVRVCCLVTSFQTMTCNRLGSHCLCHV